MCLDGHRLLGENVADLAGLRVALDAYHLSLRGHPDRMVGGLTGDQRFFLAFARRWQKVQTDAALQHEVESDIHAPGRYRSNTGAYELGSSGFPNSTSPASTTIPPAASTASEVGTPGNAALRPVATWPPTPNARSAEPSRRYRASPNTPDGSEGLKYVPAAKMLPSG